MENVNFDYTFLFTSFITYTVTKKIAKTFGTLYIEQQNDRAPPYLTHVQKSYIFVLRVRGL